MTGRIIPEYVREIREMHLLHDKEPLEKSTDCVERDSPRWSTHENTHLKTAFSRILSCGRKGLSTRQQTAIEANSRVKELKRVFNL